MLLPRHPQSQTPSAASPGTPNATPGRSGGVSPGVIAGVAVAAVVFVLLCTYFVLRQVRQRNNRPKFIPTQYLKRKWEAWHPGSRNTNYSAQLQSTTPETAQISRNNQNAPSNDLQQANTTRLRNSDVVERHTSIRSIMTLPAYSRSVRENERVLGREGERDGIDMVVEAPETEHEEEQRRDEEMESLYQIRVQRRREVAERDDRRQRRRAARERGDAAAAERVRQESLNAIGQREATGVTAMIAMHNARNRDRRIGSVSYADVGIARHDGTRIRANSNDSQRPLLDSAASLADSRSLRPWATRESSSVSVSTHRRGNMSQTSLPVSVLSEASSIEGLEQHESSPLQGAGGDFEIVTLNDESSSGPNSRANSNTMYTPSGSRSRSRASTMATNAVRPSIDTGLSRTTSTPGENNAIPVEDPPGYDDEGFEDAPPYESPIQSRVPSQQLRSLSSALSAQGQGDVSAVEAVGNEEQSQSNDESVVPATDPSKAPTAQAESRLQIFLPEIIRLPSIRIASATPIDALSPTEFPQTSTDSEVSPQHDHEIGHSDES